MQHIQTATSLHGWRCTSTRLLESFLAGRSGLIIMDWRVFLTIFGAVFIAELGDKTQLATMLFATDKEVSKYTVFFAASAALIVASALGVLAGTLLSEYVNQKYLHYIAGLGFIGIGILTLYNASNISPSRALCQLRSPDYSTAHPLTEE
jgi:putative Ca2+/H+ antiporter (TMEM165/GDT1 family)